MFQNVSGVGTATIPHVNEMLWTMTHPTSIRRIPKEVAKLSRRVRFLRQTHPGPIRAVSLSGFVSAGLLQRFKINYTQIRAQPVPDTEKAVTF